MSPNYNPSRVANQKIANFLSVNDLPNIQESLQLAKSLKSKPFAHQHLGKNKTLVLLFFNPSLRTRLSTQKAAQNLGMNVMVMNVGNDGWKIEFEDGAVMDQGTTEHIKEAAAVVSQYADIIGIRTFPTLTDKTADDEEKVLMQFVNHAQVPVISLESATRHPLQGFADLLTIEEHKHYEKPKVVLTWAPHPKALPQAVSNSFVNWMKKGEVNLVIANPEGYNLPQEITQGVPIIHHQEEAFQDADFIYAKSWASYDTYGQHLAVADSWTITAEKMALTNQAKFMHCLPVRRNVVVTDEVIDSANSLVIQQAHNRTFAAQAVLKQLLAKLEKK